MPGYGAQLQLAAHSAAGACRHAKNQQPLTPVRSATYERGNPPWVSKNTASSTRNKTHGHTNGLLSACCCPTWCLRPFRVALIRKHTVTVQSKWLHYSLTCVPETTACSSCRSSAGSNWGYGHDAPCACC